MMCNGHAAHLVLDTLPYPVLSWINRNSSRSTILYGHSASPRLSLSRTLHAARCLCRADPFFSTAAAPALASCWLACSSPTQDAFSPTSSFLLPPCAPRSIAQRLTSVCPGPPSPSLHFLYQTSVIAAPSLPLALCVDIAAKNRAVGPSLPPPGRLQVCAQSSPEHRARRSARCAVRSASAVASLRHGVCQRSGMGGRAGSWELGSALVPFR